MILVEMKEMAIKYLMIGISFVFQFSFGCFEAMTRKININWHGFNQQ